MINNYLEQQIKENFQYQPTIEQEFVVKSLVDFLLSPHLNEAFILRGYAGTGKTSLMGAVVKTMDVLKQKVVLLAPTGRAAKVLSLYTQHPAFTIHKKIYRQQTFSNEMNNFSLNDNLFTYTLFVVDEASMISNEGLPGASFGTGRLLEDLVRFVYSGTGCRLLLIGDIAQLPPVGEEESPALSVHTLEEFGLDVKEADLIQVVRQTAASGILCNATRLRDYILKKECATLPLIRLKGFADIQVLSGSELLDTLASCYEKVGLEETMVICRSNKRANQYNQGIRSRILFREEEIGTGDLLMVTKNNYYWGQKHKEMDFIANGDIAVVRRINKNCELYGFHFAQIILSFPDYNDIEIEANVLLDTLYSDAATLNKDQNDKLFFSVLEDYADARTKKERMLKMKEDIFYNALQVKFAYAVTAHKAQGGQWKKVFIDQGYINEGNLTQEYFRWLYTAFTRATQTLYLVNYPKQQIE